MRRIPIDYDNRSLRFVRQEAFKLWRICPDMIDMVEIWLTSPPGNRRLVLVCVDELTDQQGEYLIENADCDPEWYNFVKSRGFTERLLPKYAGGPKPTIEETHIRIDSLMF